MIEVEIREYLLAALATVPVYLETPEQVPTKYVRLERTGGSCEDHIFSGTFAVQSISSESLYEAAELNEAVIAAMLEIDAPSVSVCRLNSSYNYTNTETKEHRYQAVFQIYYYGGE